MALGLRPRYLLVVGAVSLITMPITAIWFLLIGAVVLMSAAVVSAARPTRTGWSATVVSVGVGLLVGPAVYLSLAVGGT